MLVCHIITGLGSGGAERMLTRIVSTSNADETHFVISLMDEGVHGKTIRDTGVELVCLGMRRGTLSLPVVARLAKLLRKRSPDIIMTWLYHADFVGTVSAVFAGLGTRRVVWNLRCSDIDFDGCAPSTKWVVRTLSYLSGLPRTVAFNSYAGRAHHEALGYRPRSWVHLPNGLDLDEWHPSIEEGVRLRQQLGLSEKDVLVAMVARLDPQKDHATFLTAAKHVAMARGNVQFMLVGEGIETLAWPAELDGRMHALGFRSDIQNLMRAMDVHVLSSFGEGFPNVVCEAMATAVPCIVSNVGDAARIVGSSGIVVPPADPDALARAILQLTDEPREHRLERGRTARKLVEQNFSISSVRQAYSELFSELSR